MGLGEYRQKRDFTRTPEPKGEEQADGTGLRFVVQKHAATRLHYDLRLELDGSLKSWAVPKGPGRAAGDKRLAVHVEDHPLEYGEFEGIIPEGEYGGGTVLIWDRGTWEPLEEPRQGYARGELKFLLHGRKLRGKWTLVRLKPKEGEQDKNWLLIKGRDDRTDNGPDPLEMELSVVSGRTMEEIARQRSSVWGGPHLTDNRNGPDPLNPGGLSGAVAGEQPRSLSPQLATPVSEPPTGEGWLHEIKYDGYRIICFVTQGRARMVSRRGQDWTERFESIAGQAASLGQECILDGEVAVLRPDGTTDFQALQNVLKGRDGSALTYHVFDLPHCSGFDLTAVPLLRRKELLRALLPPEGAVRFSDHIQGRGDEVLRNACRLGLEGIISKRADSTYQGGRRSSWLKVKCSKRQEFVIGGYSEPSGSRRGFGALLVGFHEGGELRYAGRVGTGYTEKTLADLSARLSERRTDHPPFVDPPRGAAARGVHWVHPDLVAEVEYTEWTREGALRHPSFKGLREDKSPAEVGRERELPLRKALGPIGRGGSREAASGGRVAGIRVSNPDRVVFPKAGITKGEVARYYEAVADVLLPHVIDRPLTVIRCPEGIGGQCFYQKHLYENLPPSIHGVEVREKKQKEPYILIRDLEGLIGLVQMGVIELHPWGSRAETLELPDTMVFDLDPDPTVPWSDVVLGANLIRNHLLELGLTPFVKTSGGKGLHIVVPLQPKSDWSEVKAFAGAVARDLVRMHEALFVATMSKSKRAGRIFIDHFRNSRGATSVSAYSLRAREEAPVSTPLQWEELPEVRPDTYTLRTFRDRPGTIRKEPWKGYSAARRPLPGVRESEAGLSFQ
jgi:bifunctional non-homologous end joining protein LigD